MSDHSKLSLEKRTWCYAQPPSAYEIAPCNCGNLNTQWSEFVGHLWCDMCQKDFAPSHPGVFAGPIPPQLSALMGLKFDRIDLATQKIHIFDPVTCEYAST